MPHRYHLNADVGEGFPDDDSLLKLVTQANVACGGHAGDASTMRRTCQGAVRRDVEIGAQVSYQDREGFGRRPLDVAGQTLVEQLTEQVQALRDAAAAVGGSVAYLKPHGALYNRVVWDAEQAEAVTRVCQAERLPLMCLPGSVALRLLQGRGGDVLREFFADRGYDAAGRLLPRDRPGALVDDPDRVTARVRQLIDEGTVTADDGTAVEVSADSICVHGDTPRAVELARAVREALGTALR